MVFTLEQEIPRVLVQSDRSTSTSKKCRTLGAARLISDEFS
jgi:hypothetical protein